MAVKFKLDENLDVRLALLLSADGHEADTVLDQRLSGQPDEVIYRKCMESGHVLITLDLDYSNPLRFPPSPSSGIVVLRPQRQILPAIRRLLQIEGSGGTPLQFKNEPHRFYKASLKILTFDSNRTTSDKSHTPSDKPGILGNH